jgi:hypothetical protein
MICSTIILFQTADCTASILRARPRKNEVPKAKAIPLHAMKALGGEQI